MMQLFQDSSINSINSCSLLEQEYNDFSVISADPGELFEGLCAIPRSISDDIKLLESGLPEFSGGSLSSDTDDFMSLPEIRNYNCMWSSYPSHESQTCTLSPTDSMIPTAVPLEAIIGNSVKMTETVIKIEPVDETEKQRRTTPRLTQQQQQQQQQSDMQQNSINQQSMQKIPPGTSLLLKSRKTTTQQMHKKVNNNNNNNNNNHSIQIPVIPTSEFLRDRDIIAPSTLPTFGRPDTPPSLDDDATEFKHSYDLRACVIGSNNISLLEATDPDKTTAINMLREQLEDTNKKIVPSPSIMPSPSRRSSFSDILSIIKEEASDDSDAYMNQDFGYTHNSLSSQQQNNSSGDCDSSDDASFLSDEDATSLVSKRSGCSSSLSFTSNAIGNSSSYPIKHSDHSYTRSKDGIDDISPNLETPSDSDEEIDVVSLGDKKLPTNPSDKDRRALQTKVAHKFSARIVKTPNGLRTIPPRQRVSYDTPYTPASVSPVKSSSSLVNSRYPSPARTPYSSSQYSSSSSSSSSSKHHHHSLSSSARKRIANNCSLQTGGCVIINGFNSDEFMPPSKRHRGKKQKTQPNVTMKRRYSVDEVDTIEKRNLHNDMERQRRIGLKNLFEALKKQIPSIKDKERAPKVNILREAAKLCENLTREEQHLTDQLDMLREQFRKRQEILNQLRLKQKVARGC